MQLVVTYDQQPLTITMTSAAAEELAERSSPLFVDAQLRFGCLAKKTLVFNDEAGSDQWQEIHSKLQVSFQSMVSDSCRIDGEGSLYHPTPRKIGQLHWLHLDYVDHHWRGEFGLEEKKIEHREEQSYFQGMALTW